MADQFENAEREFLKLKGQLAAGRINQTQFDAALKGLMFQDAQGRYWMIGADTGAWYVHDGKQWVSAQPPGARAAPPPARPAPPTPLLASTAPESLARNTTPSPLAPHATPMPQSPPLALNQPATGSGSKTIVFAIAAIAVVCVVGIIGVFFAANQGLLKVSLSSPTNTPAATFPPPPTLVVLVAAPTVPTAPTVQLAPTAASTQVVTPTATLTPTLTASQSIARADALTYQSQFMQAIAIYQQVAQADPSNAVAHAHWGRALAYQAALELRSGLYTSAISQTEAAALIAPNDPEVAIWLSRTYDWSLVLDKALAAAQKAVLLAPNSAQANAVYAEALSDNNRLADADAAVQKALQLDPNNADAHRIAGLLLNNKQQVPAAVAELEKAVAADPSLALRWSELGTLYRRAKDYAKAGEAFQKSISFYPQAASAHVGLGISLIEQKMYDQAIAALTRAIQINDASPEAHYQLGQAYYGADKCAQALPEYQRTIDLNPRANAAMTYLGLCQLKAGNIAAASAAAQQAAAIDPNFADTKTLLASITAASATPTPIIAPGLYVTSIRSDPPAPGHGQDVGFYATFLNTNPTSANLRWLIYIYKADSPTKSFGETPSVAITLLPGAGEQKAAGAWRTGIGSCDNFVARAAWLDDNKKPTTLLKPDGSPFELAFSVC